MKHSLVDYGCINCAPCSFADIHRTLSMFPPAQPFSCHSTAVEKESSILSTSLTCLNIQLPFSLHTLLLFLFIILWLPLPSLLAAKSSQVTIEDFSHAYTPNKATFDIIKHGKVNVTIEFHKRTRNATIQALYNKIKNSQDGLLKPFLQDTTFNDLLDKELEEMRKNGKITSSYSYVPTGAPLDQTKTEKDFQKKAHETHRSADNSKQQATKNTPPTNRTPSSHNGNKNKPRGSNTRSSQAKSEISSTTANSFKGKTWRNKFVKRGAFAIALFGAGALARNWYYWPSKKVEKVNNADAPNDKKEEKAARHFRFFLSLCGLGLLFLALYYLLRKRDT